MRNHRSPYRSLSPTVSGTSPEQRLWAALVWRDGYDRAQAIMSGRDEATNADLAKWRTLGEPK